MIFKKRSAAIVSLLVLFCFFSMTVGDAWPLPETAEQDGIALIEKGEQKLSENLHLEALGLFNQAMSLVKEKDSRARIFLGLARVHFALGYKEKCSEFLRILLEIDPAMQLRRTEMPGDFATFFDQELSLMQQQRLAEQKRLEEQKLAEQKKLQEQRLADELKKADELLAKEKEKAAAEKAEPVAQVTEEAKKGEPQPQVQEKEKPLPVIKKKKKFPLLLVILSAGVVVVLIAMLGKKKKSEPQPPTPPPATTKYTLTVTVGAGASGTPASGTYTYDRGSSIAYSYTGQSGTSGLKVRKNGTEVSASGAITMDGDCSLSAIGLYALTVSRTEGVKGTPVAGKMLLEAGQSVKYSFSPQPSYVNLKATLDGKAVANSGTIKVDKKKTLTAKATWSGVYDIRGRWDGSDFYYNFSGTLNKGKIELVGWDPGDPLVAQYCTYSVNGKRVYFSLMWAHGYIRNYSATFISPTVVKGVFSDNESNHDQPWKMERPD